MIKNIFTFILIAIFVVASTNAKKHQQQNEEDGGDTECCACTPTPDPVCTSKPVDIMLVIDDSRSVKVPQKEKVLDFLHDFSQVLDISNSSQRVAMLQFSKSIYDQTDFNHECATDKGLFLEQLQGLKRRRRNGATDHKAALQYTKMVFDESSREDVDKVVVFVTDGISFDQMDCGKPRKGDHQIQCARDAYAELVDAYPDLRFVYLAVGLAEEREGLKELFTWDSYSPDLVIEADFENLSDFTEEILEQTCASLE